MDLKVHKKYQELSIQPHSLTTFEISKYYRNEHRFNGVSSRDNLPNKGWDMYNKSWWVLYWNSLDSLAFIK